MYYLDESGKRVYTLKVRIHVILMCKNTSSRFDVHQISILDDSTSNETWVGNEETLDAGTSPRTFRSMAMLILTIRNKLLSLHSLRCFLMISNFHVNVCVFGVRCG
jgi:hypothetical protein